MRKRAIALASLPLVLCTLLVCLAACGTPETVVQTVVVPQTVISQVLATVEVTREVPVTREAPVTREVQVTREIERVVTATPLPTAAPSATRKPSPAPTNSPVPAFGNLTVDQAMQAFLAAGLECVNAEPVSVPSGSPLPMTYTEAKRCVVPSVEADHGLRVFAFATERDLKMVKDYYEGFSGMLGSYVYVRDNLLFQTSVTMPKDLADRYRDVFESFVP